MCRSHSRGAFPQSRFCASAGWAAACRSGGLPPVARACGPLPLVRRSSPVRCRSPLLSEPGARPHARPAGRSNLFPAAPRPPAAPGAPLLPERQRQHGLVAGARGGGAAATSATEPAAVPGAPCGRARAGAPSATPPHRALARPAPQVLATVSGGIGEITLNRCGGGGCRCRCRRSQRRALPQQQLAPASNPPLPPHTHYASMSTPRPAALNALNLGMVRRLLQLYAEWGRPGSGVHCIIIRGAGGKVWALTMLLLRCALHRSPPCGAACGCVDNNREDKGCKSRAIEGRRGSLPP